MSIPSLSSGGGISIGELKDKMAMSHAHQKTQKNGLDEIYVKGTDGKKYVAYGESIKNAESYKVGDDISLKTSEGKTVTGIVAFVDDEATSALEGALKPFQDAKTWALSGAAGAGAGLVNAVGIPLQAGLAGGATVGLGAVAVSALAGGAFVALSAGAGFAIYGAIKGSENKADDSQLKSMLK